MADLPGGPQSSTISPPWWGVVGGLAVIGLGGALIGGIGGASGTSAVASSSSAISPSSEAPSTAPSTTPSRATPTSTVPSTPAAAPTLTTVPPTTASPSAVDFVMPDLVGTDLQSAQDAVQELGVFYSVSHDLLGSRNQVNDSNWIVCDQNVAPGERVTGDVEGQLDFGVVKREESCP
ncbi:PASTA domain-containing protein [Blastococcus aggregatus]|uniref:PASTA domain-containing protein n=1 Tax=Blastococcus aggregatus TaxID=38502 RepID=A0A285V830_9ACTN|nr:PASTA domain-containing protein [Blastococcus aggregatus]SOC50272.1 PASTA domain-containing protein [Blastococcus aggregatus]